MDRPLIDPLSALKADNKDIAEQVYQAAKREGFELFTALPESQRLLCVASLTQFSQAYLSLIEFLKPLLQVEDQEFAQAERSAQVKILVPGEGSEQTAGAARQEDLLRNYISKEVRRHRKIGVQLSDFLVLLKNYRRAFLRSLSKLEGVDTALFAQQIELLFDRMEIASGGEWARQSQAAHGLEVKEREVLWQRVFNAVREAIFVHDGATGKVLDLNLAAERMYGATRSELLSSKAEKFSANISPYTTSDSLQWITKARDQGPQRFEWHARQQNGELFWTDVSLCYVPFVDGDRVIAVVRDVSEQKRLEKHRLNFELGLLETQRLESLGLLAGGIAHDFNNLLTSIMGNAELARLSKRLDSNVNECLEAIDQASGAAAGLCQKMLHYAGQGTVRKEQFEIQMLIADTQQIIASSLAENVKFKIQVAPNLPTIRVDKSQIQQVLTNLLLNAAESLEGQGGEIILRAKRYNCDARCIRKQLQVSPLQPGEYLCIEVEDTGCGMDDEAQKNIFEPFYSTKFFGRGLGMAAVLGIARSYGGFMAVDSKVGIGSRVGIYVPLREVAPAAVGGVAAAKKILIVDDEEEVRSVLGRMVETLGLGFVEARTGYEALEIFARMQGSLCCVALDWSMPGLGGVETFAQMQALNDQIPIVMMTGHDINQLPGRFSGAQPQNYVQKPFRMEHIQEIFGSFVKLDQT